MQSLSIGYTVADRYCRLFKINSANIQIHSAMNICEESILLKLNVIFFYFYFNAKKFLFVGDDMVEVGYARCVIYV